MIKLSWNSLMESMRSGNLDNPADALADSDKAVRSALEKREIDKGKKMRKALGKIKTRNDQSEEKLKAAKAKLDAKMEFIRQNVP